MTAPRRSRRTSYRLDEFQARLDPLLRKRDWSDAASLARSRLGRLEESAEADALAERLMPIAAYFKVRAASRLIGELGRPADGLAKLAEAEPLLEPNERSWWTDEKGLALLALGRDAEAVASFQKLATPERLTGMRTWNYIGLVDFRLVSKLIGRRVLDLCVAYLEAAEEIAVRHNPDRVDMVRTMLAEARQTP